MIERKHMSLRIDKRIKEKIAKIAANDRRSASNLVEIILEQYLNNLKK